MKIGILTFHDTYNFGACLQVYALSEILREWGHETEIINYHNDYLSSHRVIPISSFSYYAKNPKALIKAVLFEKTTRQRYRNLKAFLFSSNSLSKAVTSIDINDVLIDKDLLIIGSDQVWNLKINDNDYTFFGKNISEKVPCLTYGVSAGEVWMPEQVNNILKYIGRFNCFLVREQSLADQLRKILGDTKEIYVVADPTVLLPHEKWEKIKGNVPEYSFKNYFLIYHYDRTLLQYAKNYAKKKGLKVIAIYDGRHIEKNIQTVKVEKIEQWLWLIQNATVIYTSSYHCTLFALYFHTDFYVYNIHNSERLKSLLCSLKLENRNVCFEQNTEVPIVWKDIDKSIDEMRETSLNHLSDMLNKTKMK